MPFQIIRNDITRVAADAIVNTANPYPIVGAGVDYAVHKAAGPELLEARIRIGQIPVGGSAATPAFRLPARYVLHTVSPAWRDGRHNEETLLRRAYDSALALADELGCRSVAFPLMAAGSYAFPVDTAISVAVGAFTDFLLEHEMRIELVLFNAEAFDLAGSLFDGLKSFIDENYVEEKRGEEYFGSAPHNRPGIRRDEVYTMAALASPLEVETDSLVPFDTPAADLSEYLSRQEKGFSEYLLDLLRERSEKDSEVYKRAEISRQLFHKILHQKGYRPTKDTVIQLAIGLRLDMEQTQSFLEKAGYTLTRSSKADLVVAYYIQRGVYSVTFINEALFDCGLPLLKTGQKT